MTDGDVDDLEQIMIKLKRFNKLQTIIPMVQGQLEEKMRRVEDLSGESNLKKAARCLERRRKLLDEKTKEKLQKLEEWEAKWKEVLP